MGDLDTTNAAVWGEGLGPAIASALEAEGARVRRTDGEQDIASLAAAAGEDGGLDLMVICVDAPADIGPLEQMSDAAWERELDRHLGLVFRGIRAALAEMRPRGAGRILVTTSVESKMARPGASAYVAAQHGVLGLVKSVAHEVGRSGIAVNALVCGVIGEAVGEADEDLLDRSALKRANTPEEVAAAAVMLASPAATSITGTMFPVHGGTLPY